MQYNWFASVYEELGKSGIDRHQCGVKVLAEIRNCWLENMTPEQTAQKVKSEFFS